MVKWLIALLTTISLSFPIEIISDRLFTDPEGNLVAEGNVHVDYRDYVIKAEKVKYNPKTGDVFAYGRVQIVKKDKTFEVVGKEAYLNLKTHKGYFLDAEGRFREFYFSANRVEKITENELIVHKGDITTCPPDRKELKICFWRAKVTSSYVFSYSDSLEFFGIPLAYTPLIIFPVGDRRSGLLPPMIGANTYNNFIYIQPFFWAISEDRDATFTLDYRNKQAKGGSIEYRQAFTERDRFFFRLSYYKEPTPPGKWWEGRDLRTFRENRFRIEMGLGYRGWKIGLDLPSDPYFFEDVYFSQSERTRPFTLSYISYTRLEKDYFLSFNLRNYYDLTSPDNKRTLNLLPEFGFYFRPKKYGLAYVSLTASFTNFDRDEGVRSRRLIFVPQAEIPMKLLGLRNYLNLKFINNFYFTEREEFRDEKVTAFYFEDRLPLFWNFSWGKLSLSNTIELVYTFSPENFDNPQFDNFDRVTKENNFKFRLRHTLLSESRTLASLFLEGGYNFLKSYRFPTDSELVREEFLPLRMIFSLYPLKWLSISEDMTYDPNLRIVATSVSSASLKLGNLSLNGSYVSSRNSKRERLSDQYTLGMEISSRGMVFGASSTRDNIAGKELYRRLYLGYRGACWALRLDYRSTYYGSEKGYLNEVYLVFNIFNLRDIKLPLRRR